MTRLCHSKWVLVTQFGAKSLILNGALGGTRTPDTLVRSQVLYPAELRAQWVFNRGFYLFWPEFDVMTKMVGRIGFEPMTQRLKASCSTN
ncbi:hypothetical protein Lwor_0766 [Legionella worsleiensis]|uniref:Uncharacterized protein n=1 Tax=Legionella worsleiensis TaxID=45076 RepID=A0A0W1AIT4_9GAMM|nr:hypothetical protein Lwor_0766 [Legionella worsleiensis]